MNPNELSLTYSTDEKALILFADVIDSSKYSSVLPMEEYVNQLLEIQKLFVKLGRSYFPIKDYNVSTYTNVDARGDEGTIFYVDQDADPVESLHKAIMFAYELKANLELQHKGGPVPRPINMGIGIHYGTVALMSYLKEISGRMKSLIHHIEGFSINYAKRIESASRIGKYSKIFLSKDAAALISQEPIILVKHNSSLKGIDSNEEVYEVMSAFFDGMPFCRDEFEKFIDTFGKNNNDLNLLRNPWLKGLIVSVLDTRLQNCFDITLKSQYKKQLSEFAWQSPVEDDPILLFWRAKECGEDNNHTLRITYLKNIIKNHPNFLHARIHLAKACWDVATTSSESAEIIYARDTAYEFINKFSDCLSEEEKQCYLKILNKSS